MYQKVARTFSEMGITHTTDHNQLLKYSTDESIFSIGPQMIVFPKNAEDVVRIVRVVRDYTKAYPDISLTVRAGGTGLSGGSLNDSIIMDISSLNHMGQMEEDDEFASVWVGPGVYYRDIENLIEKKGYMYPAYPSSKDICMIGGMVANNAAGPNSLKYGHTVEFIDALEVVLSDGTIHTFEPISYVELEQEMRRDDRVGEVYRFVWDEFNKNEKGLKNIRPESSKNSAGYELGDILQAPSLDAFKKGDGYFNMVHALCGSQGTIGVVTNIKLRVIPQKQTSRLLLVPIYTISKMGKSIVALLTEGPYNIEVFDDISYKLALKNPGFFRSRFDTRGEWLVFVFKLYTSFLFTLGGKVPIYTLLVKFDADTKEENIKLMQETCAILDEKKIKHNFIANKKTEDSFWKIREASYSLAKLASDTSRPAAFLEDMVVPPEHIPAFLTKVRSKLQKHGLRYAMHGHGGNGHFHFYPLFDFTDEQTPERLYKIAHEFYELAAKYEGNICGEHNDGIMRTPFLGLVFTEEELDIFRRFEHAADPDDIFNPGKKVNPKFDIRGSIRNTN